MAAITPDATKDELFINDMRGKTHRRPQFITQTVSNGDTFDTGINSVYTTAWEPINTTDQVATTYSGSTVTFSAPAGNHAGYLHIFSEGY